MQENFSILLSVESKLIPTLILALVQKSKINRALQIDIELLKQTVTIQYRKMFDIIAWRREQMRCEQQLHLSGFSLRDDFQQVLQKRRKFLKLLNSKKKLWLYEELSG